MADILSSDNQRSLTGKARLEILRKQIENERSSFISHWRDIQEYILPRRARFTVTDKNKGDKRNQKIINNAATLAARTLRAGMMSGLTSPARPWFRLTTWNPELAERASVKRWLHLVEIRMREVFLRSNLYNALPNVYGDNGTFGTAAMVVLEDDKDIIRCYTQPIGMFGLANDSRHRAAVFTRELTLTVRQIVERFAEFGGKSGRVLKNMDMVSDRVQASWKGGRFEEEIKVNHIVSPNDDADPRRLAAKFKPFKSCYYEEGTEGAGESDRYLSESGFNEFPVMAPRWETTGEDCYGTTCPGMECLGDVKALQVMEKRKAQAIEKHVNPPMTGPSSLKQSKASIIAGDITYLDVREGQQGFRPVHEVKPDVSHLKEDIEFMMQRISRTYFEDLFLMLAMSDRREITAREIDERHEEKLLMLGPVLERQNDELLDPLIDRTFAIMERRQMIPRPPRELEGEKLKVEYISILAQAQRQVGTAGVERLISFAGRVAEIHAATAAVPAAAAVLDKIDFDQTIDDYGGMLGVSPNIIRSDDEVVTLRAERQQTQQAAEKLALAAQTAEIGKTLSDTDLEGKNAITDAA